MTLKACASTTPHRKYEIARKLSRLTELNPYRISESKNMRNRINCIFYIDNKHVYENEYSLKIREDTLYMVAFTKLSNRTDHAQAPMYLFWSCLKVLHCICKFGIDL
jgi:hypothetical protein